jgi:hypothetical protein
MKNLKLHVKINLKAILLDNMTNYLIYKYGKNSVSANSQTIKAQNSKYVYLLLKSTSN